MNHLTEEQLLERRAGALGRDAAQHVQECEQCRRRLLDDRLLDVLIGQVLADAPKNSSPGHPPIEHLLLFVEGAMDAYESAQLEAHLTLCETCTARVLTLHRSGYETPVAEPPARLTEQVRSRILSVPSRRSLGQIFLETVDLVVTRLAFRPSAPGSAFILSGGLAAAAALPTVSEPNAPYGNGRILTLNLGVVSITIRAEQSGGDARLAIQALDSATNAPVANLRFELAPDAGDAKVVLTDIEGMCHLRVPHVRTRLVIHTTPVSEIELSPVAVG